MNKETTLKEKVREIIMDEFGWSVWDENDKQPSAISDSILKLISKEIKKKIDILGEKAPGFQYRSIYKEALSEVKKIIADTLK